MNIVNRFNFVQAYKCLQEDIKLNLKVLIYKGTPIVLYQMGKVGSSSIAHSLSQSGIQPIFHVHNLSLNSEFYRIKARQRAMFLHKKIISKNKKVKFISLVREPIARNISAFFQNFDRLSDIKYNDSSLSIQNIQDIFLNKFDHRATLKWFDSQIKIVLGIDVYKYFFPKEKGAITIAENNFDLLIIKSEIHNKNKEKYIANFLNLEEFKITNRNIGNTKPYKKIYQLFLEEVQLPKDYVEEMCSSKYFNHFYTEDEITQVKNKWMRS